MKNKVLVRMKVPEIDKIYDVYLPISIKIGNKIILVNKAISEMTNNEFKLSNTNVLYNSTTGERYDLNSLLLETDIRNGSELTLLT